MRKLKLQMQLSIDGYCAGPNGEMDWMTWNFDDQLKKYISDITAPVDCILLGRKLAEGFIPVWESRLTNPDGEDMSFIRKMNETRRIVFSKSVSQPGWKNAEINGDLVSEIKKLRQQEGGDIIMYGGANFASNVIQANLVDEYHLFFHPAAIGRGLAPFPNRMDLERVQSKSFPCGITLIQYKSKRE